MDDEDLEFKYGLMFALHQSEYGLGSGCRKCIQPREPRSNLFGTQFAHPFEQMYVYGLAKSPARRLRHLFPAGLRILVLLDTE